MNNIKDGVCIDHFPDYNYLVAYRYPSTEYNLLDDTIEKLTNNLCYKKHKEVEDALADYLLFKYNIPQDEIKSKFKNVHNVKLKSFRSFIRKQEFKHYFGQVTDYVDNGKVFLSVVECDCEYRILSN